MGGSSTVAGECGPCVRLTAPSSQMYVLMDVAAVGGIPAVLVAIEVHTPLSDGVGMMLVRVSHRCPFGRRLSPVVNLE
eukprot:scaffold98794_cov31-Phaeocystis_antarctica.AAC.1